MTDIIQYESGREPESMKIITESIFHMVDCFDRNERIKSGFRQTFSNPPNANPVANARSIIYHTIAILHVAHFEMTPVLLVVYQFVTAVHIYTASTCNYINFLVYSQASNIILAILCH